MRKAVAGITLMMVCGAALAQLPSNDPSVVCGYLTVEQLPTGIWTVDENKQGRCASEGRTFGNESAGALNQLSYEARGYEDNAWILQVILDVNPQQALSTSNQAFLQASQRLSTTALGKRLPSTISSAITGGRNAGAVVGNTTLTVKRQEHESGSGYQMRFSME